MGNDSLTIPLPDRPRILIVKLSAVGDVVHALPVARAIKARWPESHVGWAVHPAMASLLKGHPHVDEVVEIPRRFFKESLLTLWSDARKLLRANGQWDVAIDLQGLAKSGLVTKLSGATVRIGFDGPWSREFNGLFMTNRIRPAAQNIIPGNLEMLRPLGIEDAHARGELVFSNTDENYIRAWAEDHGLHNQGKTSGLILDPFAGWTSKLWPQSRWVKLATRASQELNLRPIIFYGPGEADKATALLEIMPNFVDAILAPPTTLPQYAALLKNYARAIVAGDTGPMHMAAMEGIPCVAMFGPSSPERNGPMFDEARVICLKDSSQPCSGTYTRRCKHHAAGECMTGIGVNQVMDALSRVLSKEAEFEVLDVRIG